MTTQAPISVLQEASRRWLKLEAHGDELHVIPGDRVPADFVPILRAHKPALLALLQLPFAMVYLEILGEAIFFCEDDDTKAPLVEAGADPWSIYTKHELRVLVAHNRARPFLPDELCKLHEIKRTLHGRITK
jgi:hypothetical protein